MDKTLSTHRTTWSDHRYALTPVGGRHVTRAVTSRCPVLWLLTPVVVFMFVVFALVDNCWPMRLLIHQVGILNVCGYRDRQTNTTATSGVCLT